VGNLRESSRPKPSELGAPAISVLASAVSRIWRTGDACVLSTGDRFAGFEINLSRLAVLPAVEIR
jgi:hypothetical protein